MWFLYCLTWLSFLIQICFGTISIVSGLYYLAELVEEYTVIAKKVITWITVFVFLCFCGLWLFEELPLTMSICGIIGQMMYFLILRTFPYVSLKSPSFVLSIIVLIVNHYFAFHYFGTEFHSFSEVIAYFTICVWMVPFVLFISLSANDHVLPTTVNSSSSLLDDSDVVTKYFSKKNKKYGLLPLFHYLKDSVLPERNKKVF
ncbi:protein TEX261 [Planococcus citri]|uniref:protein TEX261 n=1 Tax=Planococcus citri TaxID=170843 RepID=UPI0031F96983